MARGLRSQPPKWETRMEFLPLAWPDLAVTAIWGENKRMEDVEGTDSLILLASLSLCCCTFSF